MSKMARVAPVLHVDPAKDIVFKGPFTEASTVQILLTNPAAKLVCFKLKTSVKKTYSVHPPCGIIKPYGTAVITIKIQPIISEAILFGNRHKVKIMSIFAASENIDPVSAWKNAVSEEITSYKLNVTFDLPQETGLLASDSEVEDGMNSPAACSDSLFTVEQDSSLEISDPKDKTFGCEKDVDKVSSIDDMLEAAEQEVTAIKCSYPAHPCVVSSDRELSEARSTDTDPSNNDDSYAHIHLDIKRLIDNNRHLRAQLATVTRENMEFRKLKADPGLTFTDAGQDLKDEEEIKPQHKEMKEPEPKEIQMPGTLLKWICNVLACSLFFTLGVICGSYFNLR